MKILAVDDEPLFLEILEVALQDLNLTDVTPIYSAKEALRELESGKTVFDCILLDIRMPGMNGVDLCRKIRAVAGYKRTPIVMVTAMTDREFIEEAFAAGASDYLTKPLDPLELRARMTMVERLIAEQARNVLLEQRSPLPFEGEEEIGEVEEIEFTLDAPVVLQGFDRIIAYSAMENYLTSLSGKNALNTDVLAISIHNARGLYDTARRIDFMNALYDVGVTIETVLKRFNAMIAYAGDGVFVAVTNAADQPDSLLLEDQIRGRMADFDQIYQRDQLPTPQVKVGPAISKPLGKDISATDLLQAAISAIGAPAAQAQDEALKTA